MKVAMKRVRQRQKQREGEGKYIKLGEAPQRCCSVRQARCDSIIIMNKTGRVFCTMPEQFVAR